MNNTDVQALVAELRATAAALPHSRMAGHPEGNVCDQAADALERLLEELTELKARRDDEAAERKFYD